MGPARSVLALCALALLAAAPARAAEEEDLARHVDPMIGTFAPGFIFPGAAAPFGMVQNSPDTRGEFAYSGYLWSDPAIQALSLVHLSGPGVKKGGDIPVMPVLGQPSLDPNVIQSPYDHATEKAEPGYYSVFLAKPATKAELTASEHAAMQRYTFPSGPVAPKLVFDPARSVEGVADGGFRVIGDSEVAGWRRGRYPVFFVARFSRPFDSSGQIGNGGWVGWDEGGEVTVSFGISFVDEDGARRNLETEAPAFDFDAMHAGTRAAWNRELSKVRVSGGSDADLESFYTALYRSQLHPNTFTDVDGRYRGMDDQIHQADGRIQYSNFSSWDLYKSWHQLIATIQPERYRDMLLSLLADHREGGFIPRWKEQSIDAAHMSGDPAIPMVADGVCRGILQGQDALDLYEAAKHLVTRREPKLLELGWLPDRPGTTLEYGIADFALALIARSLGKDGEAAEHLERSLNYRNILDPETRWIRGRDENGNWATPFDPTGGESPEQTTGRGFQEGNSWQYSWLAMHDAAGLYERMGGDAVARERLDHMFTMPPEVQNRATAFGVVYRLDQWAPGNEHDLQVPWMYHFAGAPWRAAAELVEARILYRPTIDGLPGNDDLGGLSSWHALNMLGLGALVPGAPYFALGSPAFERAEIDTARGTFTIESPGGGPYVANASLNGAPLDRAWLYDFEMTGTLRLERSSSANEAWGRENRPPSGTDLSSFGCQRGTRQAIRLKVTPRRVDAGSRTRLRVRARTADGEPIQGATIRIRRKTATTNGRGRATLRVRFARPGKYRARAAKPGYRAGKSVLRAG